MPGGDRTGPAGMGPMTGRAAGYCTGNPGPGWTNPAGRGLFGFGRGFGRGGGRGRRNRFYATGLTGWQRAAAGEPAFGAVPPVPTPAAPAPASTAADKDRQIALLKQQVESMAQVLEGINQRLDGMTS